jgi:1-acyl-sn-glycerol-3-phosphate acyltransferase
MPKLELIRKAFSEGSYRSPEKPIGWFSDRFPSLAYYPKMIGIVKRAARLANTGRYDAEEWIKSSLDTIASLESVGVRFSIENIGAFSGLEPSCVFVGNHMSTMETFALPSMIRSYREVTFVVKKSLVEYPYFGQVMQSLNPIVVGRDNPREDLRVMLAGGMERLKNGVSLIVFPQTTRTTKFSREDFNSIGVKIAKRAGVPVIPVAIRSDAWGSDGWPIRDFGRIRPNIPAQFAFGEPIEVTGNGREAQEEVVRFIQEKLGIWMAS